MSALRNGRNSVQDRLSQFFADNPDEELSYDDITAKFNCSRGTAEQAVSRLKADRLLESVHVIRLRTKGMSK